MVPFKSIRLSSDKRKCSCYSTSQFSRLDESPTHSLSDARTDAISTHESGLTDSFSQEECLSACSCRSELNPRATWRSLFYFSPAFPPVVDMGFGFAPFFVPLLAADWAVAPAVVELFVLQPRPMTTEVKEGQGAEVTATGFFLIV